MFKKKKSRALNLTPLIDVMTTIIIFILIQSSDSAVEVNDGIRLSNAEFGDSIKKSDNILVGLNNLKIGKDFEIKLQKGRFAGALSHKKEDRLINPLYDEITKRRESLSETEQKDLNMNISFDKRIPADSVKKVIYTATMAGVNNIFYVGEEKE